MKQNDQQSSWSQYNANACHTIQIPCMVKGQKKRNKNRCIERSRDFLAAAAPSLECLGAIKFSTKHVRAKWHQKLGVERTIAWGLSIALKNRVSQFLRVNQTWLDFFSAVADMCADVRLLFAP